MNFDIKSIFPSAAKSSVKVKLLRDMVLRIDGQSNHYDAGEELELPDSIARQIDPADYQVQSSIRPSAPVADPSPARAEPETAPESWKALPACFTDYFRMNAEITVARAHIRAIRETRRSIFGTDHDFSDIEGTFLAGGITGGMDRMNPHTTVQPFNASDPTTRKLARYLATSLAGAEDYLARLLEKTSRPLQLAFYQAGLHHLSLAGQAQELVDEINQTGFEVFAHRVAALGLAEWHVRRLYHGSADFLKYTQGNSYQGGTCFGGMDDDGLTRIYSDQEVQTSAGYALRDAARIIELTALLKQAKAELAQTVKASKAA